MLNFDKSCVYFSHNLSPDYCDFLAGALQMSIVTDSEKYLGAPLLLGHSKLKSFDPIMQSFEARLKNYVSITLNQSGRSILIKSVLNSLPTYQMACFKIPTTLLSKLDSLQLNFWRDHKKGKGIKFVAWDSINQAKDLGGLGFRDLESFNTALICKLVRKIVTDDEELWVQILSAKYFEDCSILHLANLNENFSWIWRGIYKYHPPIPAEGLVNTVSYSYVSDLFIENTRSWNVHLIYYLFEKDCAEKIIDMSVPATGKDKLIWLPDRKGQFTVKSVYNVLSRGTNLTAGSNTVPAQVRKSLWKVQLPHKVKLFAWKCIRDIIPTRDKLSRYKNGIETL
ncbi:uncharacterized protein LOC113356439 [Papaver somniferum]|uniref:uncharacterized protein LOC113356439 n=1 Tax=Papaver somniferum TaxID=3469 RepID=UPI000E6FCD28|nr:uncharacterized protein LOC113356439 [Papaver somniferum]